MNNRVFLTKENKPNKCLETGGCIRREKQRWAVDGEQCLRSVSKGETEVGSFARTSYGLTGSSKAVSSDWKGQVDCS